MEKDEQSVLKGYYQQLESNIKSLPKEMREKLYRPCAENCVNAYVLKEQKRQFLECNGDLDLQYKKYGRSDYFFADIIEPGRVYEIGYPKCFCQMVTAGFVNSPVHCECSRQSIIYTLHTLMPDRKFKVEALHTVLSGASECRFRITFE